MTTISNDTNYLLFLDEDEEYGPDMITLLAMHFVSQVLDEACVIIKSAKDTGIVWLFTIHIS